MSVVVHSTLLNTTLALFLFSSPVSRVENLDLAFYYQHSFNADLSRWSTVSIVFDADSIVYKFFSLLPPSNYLVVCPLSSPKQQVWKICSTLLPPLTAMWQAGIQWVIIYNAGRYLSACAFLCLTSHVFSSSIQSKVVNMNGMFFGADFFNRDLSD